MIKVKNNRITGNLFHYAHFLCDCLFVEIINDIYKYDVVIRENSFHQTLGIFDKIYNEVMTAENRELSKKDYNSLDIDIISYKNKEDYGDKINFKKFTDFIFSRYNINNLEYNTNYPDIILVKRGERMNLTNDDDYLSKKHTNYTNGKERREINNICRLETYLQNEYSDKFKSLYFENLDFEEQIKYFNNAKLIICAHGAVMSNMFFCKEQTYIIEVACGMKWGFFNTISKNLNLNHIICHQNNYNGIVDCIKKNITLKI